MKLRTLTLSAFVLASVAHAADHRVPASETGKRFEQAIVELTGKISKVEIHGIHIDARREFSWGIQPNRDHAFIRIMMDGQDGWAETTLSYNSQKTNLKVRTKRENWYQELVGLNPVHALELIRAKRGVEHPRSLESAEICLIDVCGKLLKKPALEMLGLGKKGEPAVIHTILSNDAAFVEKEAATAKTEGMTTHLKIKMFGKPELDLSLVEAARRGWGPDGYLVGDPNSAYRKGEKPEEALSELTKVLHKFTKAGLNGIEDPGDFTNPQWIQLQSDVAPLQLIPDVPMRPVWSGFQRFDPEMGTIFNLHPVIGGSVLWMSDLGQKIKASGRGLMLGDGSFVGPSCPAWQTFAIALQADWVEAIEKPRENDVFQRCLTTPSPVQWDRKANKLSLAAQRPGFGYALDAGKVREAAFEVRVFE